MFSHLLLNVVLKLRLPLTWRRGRPFQSLYKDARRCHEQELISFYYNYLQGVQYLGRSIVIHKVPQKEEQNCGASVRELL
jgi:hypothetical protein